ncbi:MAG: hypothetical protein ACREBS_03045 [Nitrososphaerales archaeon]
MDFVDDMANSNNPKTNKPYAPIYIDSHLKAIRSWLGGLVPWPERLSNIVRHNSRTI